MSINHHCILIILLLSFKCLGAQKLYTQGYEYVTTENGSVDTYICYPNNNFVLQLEEQLILSNSENSYIWAEVTIIRDFWQPLPQTFPQSYRWFRQFKLLKIQYPQQLIIPDTFSILMTKPVHTANQIDMLNLNKYCGFGSHGAVSVYRCVDDMVPDTPVLIKIAYKTQKVKNNRVDSTAFVSYDYVGDADVLSMFGGDKALGYWSYRTYLPWLFADKKDGKYHFLLANAFLIECYFKNNQLDKDFTVYSLDGHLVGQKKYKKGKLLSAFLYYYTDTSPEIWADWGKQESPITDFQTQNLNPVLQRSMDKNKVNELVFMDKISDSLISLDTTKKVLVYQPFQFLVDSLWDWNLYKKMSYYRPRLTDEEEEDKLERD